MNSLHSWTLRRRPVVGLTFFIFSSYISRWRRNFAPSVRAFNVLLLFIRRVLDLRPELTLLPPWRFWGVGVWNRSSKAKKTWFETSASHTIFLNYKRRLNIEYYKFLTLICCRQSRSMSTLNAHDARVSSAPWVRKQLQSKFEIFKYFQITIVFTNCISTDGFLLAYIQNGHRPWTNWRREWYLRCIIHLWSWFLIQPKRAHL